jgi:HK97 family phage prohead protease
MKYKALMIRTRAGSWKIAPWSKDEKSGAVMLRQEPVEIQALLFDREKEWTEEKAVEFKADNVEAPEGETTFRLIQFAATECKADTGTSTPIEGVDGIIAEGCEKAAPAEDAFTLTAPEKMARTAFGVVREVEGDTVHGFASFKTIDRYKELILPSSFEKWLPVFMKHPVMLLGHESDASVELPIGDWRKKVEIQENGLYVEGELLPEHRRYTEVRAALSRKLLALSVGFIPHKGHEASDDEIAQYGAGLRFVWDETELLEVSPVSIPANRDTLAALKSMGLKDAEQTMSTAEWAQTVRELTALGQKTGALSKRMRQAENKNWGPLVENLKKSANDFARSFSEGMTALETYLEENVGPAEPAEDPDDGGEPPAEDPANEDSLGKALHGLKRTTEGLKTN